jgi:hypothetical protein
MVGSDILHSVTVGQNRAKREVNRGDGRSRKEHRLFAIVSPGDRSLESRCGREYGDTR